MEKKMPDEFKYEITIDPKVIAILGPNLYGDTASIIAELVSNSYDADADNCWVTIKTGASPEIIIEDDGIGMTPKEVNTFFLDIGYDRRDKRSKTAKGREVFGRKGIGKLAAFSLARNIELCSLKDGQKAGCILDYDKITKEGNKNLDAIPQENIKLDKKRLSKKGTGTRLILKNIRRNVNTTYYYLVNRIIRNFNVDFDKFKIYLIKNNGELRKIDYSDLDFFTKMDVIVTIGDEFKEKRGIIKNNVAIVDKYKKHYCYEDAIKQGGKTERFPIIPRIIKATGKDGKEKEISFKYTGWLGTILNKGELKGLVYSEGADEQEAAEISFTDNRITLYSRKRIGEYDVLPKVQSDNVYDAYIIGEIHVDIFEDNELVDMAISNRRGYEETDQRYRALIEDLKTFVKFLVQRKAEVMTQRRVDKENEESEQLKKTFVDKTQTMKILSNKLNSEEQNTVKDENFQFLRAAKLAQSTKKILISHDSENAPYGFFILRIFELLGIDLTSTFIFTSFVPTAAPHGKDVYDYLKDSFREDLYIIFMFSRHFYDSDACIAEAGAAWATDRDYSNIVIDIGFDDIAKPLNSAKYGFSINDIGNIDREAVVKFIVRVYQHIGLDTPEKKKILSSIEQSIIEFAGKLTTNHFYPKRKFQGHPVCSKASCNNSMALKNDGAGLCYECSTPGCKQKIQAIIY
jgi:hypothetical protein